MKAFPLGVVLVAHLAGAAETNLVATIPNATLATCVDNAAESNDALESVWNRKAAEKAEAEAHSRFVSSYRRSALFHGTTQPAQAEKRFEGFEEFRKLVNTTPTSDSQELESAIDSDSDPNTWFQKMRETAATNLNLGARPFSVATDVVPPIKHPARYTDKHTHEFPELLGAFLSSPIGLSLLTFFLFLNGYLSWWKSRKLVQERKLNPLATDETVDVSSDVIFAAILLSTLMAVFTFIILCLILDFLPSRSVFDSILPEAKTYGRKVHEIPGLSDATKEFLIRNNQR